MDGIFTSAIIVAAGNSTRMGYKQTKQLISLIGRPAVEYTIKAFQNCQFIDEIVVVARSEEEACLQLAKAIFEYSRECP